MRLLYVYDRKSDEDCSAMVLADNFEHALKILAKSDSVGDQSLSKRAKNFMDLGEFVYEAQVLCSHV